MRNQVQQYLEKIGYLDRLKREAVDVATNSIEILCKQGYSVEKALESLYSELGGRHESHVSDVGTTQNERPRLAW